MGEVNQDCRPSDLDGLGQPSGLGHPASTGVVVVDRLPSDLGQLAFFEQDAEGFLHTPGDADVTSGSPSSNAGTRLPRPGGGKLRLRCRQPRASPISGWRWAASRSAAVGRIVNAYYYRRSGKG